MFCIMFIQKQAAMGMTYCAIVMDAEQNEINLMAAYETGTDSSEMSRCSPGS